MSHDLGHHIWGCSALGLGRTTRTRGKVWISWLLVKMGLVWLDSLDYSLSTIYSKKKKNLNLFSFFFKIFGLQIFWGVYVGEGKGMGSGGDKWTSVQVSGR